MQIPKPHKDNYRLISFMHTDSRILNKCQQTEFSDVQKGSIYYELGSSQNASLV